MEPRRRRILVIVGMKGIGDAVEALPVFALIARHLPDAELRAGYFKDKQETILAASPHVAGLVRLEGNAKDPAKSWRALVANARAMRGFESALFLYKRERIAWTWGVSARLAGTRLLHKHGYRYRDPRRDAFSDFPEYVFFQLVASTLLLGKPLGATPVPELVPGPAERAYAEALFARHGLGERPVVLINMRAPKYASMGRWGTEPFARVAAALRDRGADVVFNGGLEEQAEELEGLPPALREQVTVIGGHTPLELAAVIERCGVFIGEPSGPTFVALAVGTPAVTLQGPGDHAYPGQNRGGAVWWPPRPDHRIVSRVEACQLTLGAACTCTHAPVAPGYKRALKRAGLWDVVQDAGRAIRPPAPRRASPPRRFGCLEAIPVDAVVTAAMELLEDPPVRALTAEPMVPNLSRSRVS